MRPRSLALGSVLVLALAALPSQAGLVLEVTAARHTLTGHQGAVRALTFTPDGKLLATAGEEGKVSLWLVDEGKEWRSFDEPAPVTSLAFNADGGLLFTGRKDGAVLVRDVVLGKAQRVLQGHAAEVTGLGLGVLGQVLFSAAGDGRVQQWDAALGTALSAQQEDAPITAMTASADGKWLLSSGLADETSHGLTVAFWSAAKGRVERRLIGQSGAVASVALTAGGEWAAAAAGSGVHLWSGREAGRYLAPSGLGGPATAVAFRPDGEVLAGAGPGGEVRFWQTGQTSSHARLNAGPGPVSALAFSPSGKLLATASGSVVRLWDLSSISRKFPASEPERTLLELKPRLDTWEKSKAVETVALYQKVVDAHPADPDALLGLGQATFLASFDANGLAKMKVILARGLQADPNHLQTHLLLGEVGFQLQQWEEAELHLKKAIELDPNTVSALTRLSMVAKNKKELEKSVLLVGRVWLLQPNEVSAYNLACGLAMLGRSEIALDWLERSFQLGYSGFDGLKGDSDLDSLRALPRYAQLVQTYSHGEATASSTGTAEKSDALRSQAEAARRADKHEEAIALYQKAVAEERATAHPRENLIRRDLLWLGTSLRSLGRELKAIHAYEESVLLSDKIGGNSVEDDVATLSRQLLAGLYKSTGQHQKSLALYLKVLPAVRARGERTLEAVGLQNIGRAYLAIGRYDQALDYLKQAQAVLESILQQTPGDVDMHSNLLAVLNAQGDVFAAWGQPEKALDLYRRQNAMAREKGTPKDRSDGLRAVGLGLQALGRYEEAIAVWNESLTHGKARGDALQVSIATNSLAQSYSRWGKLDRALEYSNEALTTARLTGRGLHASLVSTAVLYQKKGDLARGLALLEEELALERKSGDASDVARALRFVAEALPEGRREEAMKLYAESLTLYQQQDDAPMQATLEKDLGETALQLGRWPEAASHLSIAVRLFERLRQTASNEGRRDYLAKTVKVYDSLIFAQLRNQDTPGAYRTLELSRAKLLAERIAGADQVAIPQVAELPALAGDGAILMFGSAGSTQPVHFVLNKTGMQAWPRPLPDSLKQKLDGPGVVGTAAKERDRGLTKSTVGSAGATGEAEKSRTQLERAIETYRALLINNSPQGREAAREMGKLFYEALIAPSLKYLVPGKTLLIVPDGALAFLPFETIIDPQGRYLGEVYDIRYVQSLSVLQLIRKRSLPPGRKPLLAFGGAVYDRATYAQDMQGAAPVLLAMADTVSQRPQEVTRGGMRDAYAAMGVRWENLAGTLAEVKALQALVPGAEIITGEDVSETRLKQLSESGELARYQTLHFATHGLVVPNLPELSALVLSQPAQQSSDQDGYLLMGEIAQLKLQADFVALSACETGLGKIYGGEGVVGLTQAFLIAGASGLSVSLWQVPDESTARFMQELYKLHQAGTDWPAAITAVKRRFLKGDFGAQWRDPHYWAPFVYYGR